MYERRTEFSAVFAVTVLIACVCIGHSRAEDAVRAATKKRWRRPVALSFDESGRWLYVANQRSGSISVIDGQANAVTTETTLGKRLSDLSIDHRRGRLFTVDESTAELIAIAVNGNSIEPLWRLNVSAFPVSITVSPDGERCFVASLWSRRLTIVDVNAAERPWIVRAIDLPFAPRAQYLLPDGKTLVVADAFGGRLGLVDVTRGELVRVRTLYGHNIRAMTVSADAKSLVVPHMQLHSDEATTEGGVHWGGVMSNVVRDVPIAELLADSSEPLSDVGVLYHLGVPDRATSDPSAVVLTKDNQRIITYAGLGEVGVSDRGANYYAPIDVGDRPTALALSRDERFVYVANTLGDSISVIDANSATKSRDIPLGPQPEPTMVEEGELLFYNARLSSDGWFSCHSCHTDGHSNGLLNDNFGDESYGAPKRVLSLLGVRNTAPWAWNGSVKSLDDQVRKSIETTMRGPVPSDELVQALTAYLLTLETPPSLTEARGNSDEQAIQRGKAVFERHGCADCHQSPSYTSLDVFDVGLEDQHGNKRFNPPSLSGVSQRERLFHDNRAATLREVFIRFNHGLGEELTPAELDDLLSFLRSL